MLALPVFGASPEELVDQERAAFLRAAAEPVIELQMKNPSPRLLPRHGELQRFIRETLRGLEPNILVETLSLYQRPPSSRQTADSAGWSRDEQTGLINQLLALSTLAGIQYYSESRKAMRIFYESSTVIEDPVKKKPLPDPSFAVCPESLELYARQKDLTFGDNIYRFEYRTGPDIILFSQENISSMNAGIIPAIGRNKFRTVMAVIDTGDSLLIYAAAMAKAASLPGMGDRIGASFSNRVKAILKWFTGRADGVFGQ
ncbi:MAG: hypothetical protein LBU85_11470 [Treponema sp.]|nr:hypothetical protein [Treponema sp.]